MRAPRLSEAAAMVALVDLVLMDPDPRTAEHNDSEIAAARAVLPWANLARTELERPAPERPKAAKRKGDPPELVAAKAAVRARSGGRCERCIDGAAEHAHHVLRRSQGGKHDPENLVDLCGHCHRVIHDHPSWAQRHGWLRSPGGPLIEPVRGCTAACYVDHRPVAS